MTGTAVAVIGDLVITSPVTTVTNLVMAAACARLAAGIHGVNEPLALRWRQFFTALALALVAGAPKHGFAYARASSWVVGATVVSGLLIGLALYAAQRAALESLVMHPTIARWIPRLITWQLLGLVAVMTIGHSFTWVLTFIGPGLVTVLAAEWLAWRRNVRGHGWIAAGLGASMVPGATYLAGWPQWPGFNHVDLAHGLILVSLWAIARGARLAATSETTR
jgi:hypothetical protein